MKHYNIYISLAILFVWSSCTNVVLAERVTAQIPNYKQQKNDNDLYNELMEKELKILKRQNKDIKYERPNFEGLNIDDSEGLDQKLRILEESLKQNEPKQKKEFNFKQMDLDNLNIPVLDTIGASCDKTMNFNKDENHVYNTLSPEEQLKKVQSELKATKESQVKSNRDIVIDKLKDLHEECFFGMTIASNTIAYKTYDSYCRKWKEMNKEIELHNKQFQTKIKGAHIKLHEIQEKFHTNHTISCGVQSIEITHNASNTLTQYISYICFDPINNVNNNTVNNINSQTSEHPHQQSDNENRKETQQQQQTEL